jgi:hypothetical protein
VWLLESQNIEEHIEHDTAPSSYTTTGKVSSIELIEHWKKEETTIK